MTAEEREDALKSRVWFIVEGATLMSLHRSARLQVKLQIRTEGSV